MKFSIKKVHIFTIIIGIIFVSINIFHTNIWFDESYSVAISKHSFLEIWNYGGNDVHPILYYWLLHIIGKVTNYSIFVYRIFSLIPIIILGILGYTHIKKDFGEKTGLFFSFLVFFLPVTAVYTNQIRMYSWALLSVSLLAIYGYRIFKGEINNKNIIIFGISSLFSIYTHYYGLMTAGLVNLFLLIYLLKNKDYKTLIKIIAFGIIQLILYIPWILNFVTQLSNVSKGFWISFEFPKTLIELTSFELIGSYMSQEKYFYLYFFIAICLYIYCGFKIFKYKKENEDLKSLKLSIFIYFSVIIAACLITLLLKSSILYYRYLFVILGIYIFILSFILSKEKNKYISIFISSIILLLSIISNIHLIMNNYSYTNTEPLDYLRDNLQENDNIVFCDVSSGTILSCLFDNKQYFYNKDHWGVQEAYKAFLPNMEVCDDTNFLNDCGDRIWITGSSDECYQLLFNNENYKLISEQKFDTKYQNILFDIILVEKIK